jgi:hypothetical protein
MLIYKRSDTHDMVDSDIHECVELAFSHVNEIETHTTFFVALRQFRKDLQSPNAVLVSLRLLRRLEAQRVLTKHRSLQRRSCERRPLSLHRVSEHPKGEICPRHKFQAEMHQLL